jgi:heme A synthase
MNFTQFAFGTLAYNIAVILWGAWVRITGSGAGCGAHWPMCNGEILPRTDSAQTLIEYSHRLTSGLTLVLGIVLVSWAWRKWGQSHRVTRAAGVALLFLFAEAALGAGLVLFELVADDDSIARAVVISLHLANTFLLLGFGALAAWWSFQPGPAAAPRYREYTSLLWTAVGGLVFIGMTGAITALGDTLFPIDPLSEGPILQRVLRDLSPTEHYLIRLRIIHPLTAITVGILLLFVGGFLRKKVEDPMVRAWAGLVVALTLAEAIGGWINVELGAPGWMQLVHLAMADFLWIATVLLMATTLSVEAPSKIQAVSASPITGS